MGLSVINSPGGVLCTWCLCFRALLSMQVHPSSFRQPRKEEGVSPQSEGGAAATRTRCLIFDQHSGLQKKQGTPFSFQGADPVDFIAKNTEYDSSFAAAATYIQRTFGDTQMHTCQSTPSSAVCTRPTSFEASWTNFPAIA